MIQQDYYSDNSLSEVHETVDATQPKTGWRRGLAYIGPAYLVSVGYMDPGNWQQTCRVVLSSVIN